MKLINELYPKLSVIFLVWLCLSYGRRRRRQFNFNCEKHCGKYDQFDRIGENLHRGCTAMKSTFAVRKKRDRKFDVTRELHYLPTPKPMPWMVLILVVVEVLVSTSEE